ncbi:hypothetical protein J6590_047836 [Homalodisca vitripennis]|nr:hypothetical protein J6590_047836 [Homalodisca vitripennis]
MKFTLEAVTDKHKKDYKQALIDIDKAWETKLNKTNKAGIVYITPTTKNKTNSTSYQITPASHKNSKSTPIKTISKNLNTGNGKTDAAVNTPSYLDLKYQIDALTDKCISLEQSLIEKNNLLAQFDETHSKVQYPINNEDFHTKILKEELCKFKAENKELQCIIELLQQDLKNTEIEINKQRDLNKKCFNCFPPLRLTNCEASPIRTTSHLTLTPNIISSDFFSENRYSQLATIDPQDKDELVIRQKNFSQKQNKNKVNNHSPETLPKHNSKSNRPNVIILSDSHGRDLGHLIEQRTTYNVCSFVRPGAGFKKVTEDVQELGEYLGGDDYILVLAGTNSVENTEVNSLVKDMISLMNKTQHTNLILGTIPMRHDVSHLDVKISTINSELEMNAMKNSGLNLLPLHLLPRHLFTTHGLHLNRRGKAEVARKIASMLSKRSSSAPTDEQNTLQQGIDNYCLQESSPVIQLNPGAASDVGPTSDIDTIHPETPPSTSFPTETSIRDVSPQQQQSDFLDNSYQLLPQT